jgi:hypothetical protein
VLDHALGNRERIESGVDGAAELDQGFAVIDKPPQSGLGQADPRSQVRARRPGDVNG